EVGRAGSRATGALRLLAARTDAGRATRRFSELVSPSGAAAAPSIPLCVPRVELQLPSPRPHRRALLRLLRLPATRRWSARSAQRLCHSLGGSHRQDILSARLAASLLGKVRCVPQCLGAAAA